MRVPAGAASRAGDAIFSNVDAPPNNLVWIPYVHGLRVALCIISAFRIVTYRTILQINISRLERLQHLQSSSRTVLEILRLQAAQRSFALALHISGAQRNLDLPRPPTLWSATAGCLSVERHLALRLSWTVWQAPRPHAPCSSCPACLIVGVVLHEGLGPLGGELRQTNFGVQQY